MRARLSPWAQGAAGAALVLVLYLAGAWAWDRYREFVVMRSVVSQMLQRQPQTSGVPK